MAVIKIQTFFGNIAFPFSSVIIGSNHFVRNNGGNSFTYTYESILRMISHLLNGISSPP